MSHNIRYSKDQNSTYGYRESRGKEQRQVIVKYKKPIGGERHSSIDTRAFTPPHISSPGFSIPKGTVLVGNMHRREIVVESHKRLEEEELRLEERKIQIKEKMNKLRRMEKKIQLIEKDKIRKLEETVKSERKVQEKEEGQRQKRIKKQIERRHDVLDSSASRDSKRTWSQNTGTSITKHKLSDNKSIGSFHGSRHKLSLSHSFGEINRRVKRRSRSFSESHSPPPRRPTKIINEREHNLNTRKYTRNSTHLCETCPDPNLHLPGPCPGLYIVCYDCQERGHYKGTPICRRYMIPSMKSRLESRRSSHVLSRLGMKTVPINNNNVNNNMETKKTVKSQVRRVNHGEQVDEDKEEDRKQFIIMEQKLKQVLMKKEEDKNKDINSNK